MHWGNLKEDLAALHECMTVRAIFSNQRQIGKRQQSFGKHRPHKAWKELWKHAWKSMPNGSLGVEFIECTKEAAADDEEDGKNIIKLSKRDLGDY